MNTVGLSPEIRKAFYRATTESILTGCITAWYGNCTAQNRKALQRVVRTAEKICGCALPHIQAIYDDRCVRKAHRIIKDPSHPNQHLFELLPSGKRYRSLKAKTQRMTNSFFPQAIRLLGRRGAPPLPTPPPLPPTSPPPVTMPARAPSSPGRGAAFPCLPRKQHG